MNFTAFPTTQGQLIRAARGARTQVEFARAMGVDRSCLSRYESETLGAPTRLINFCLNEVVSAAAAKGAQAQPVHEALAHARLAVKALEHVCDERIGRPKRSRT